MAEALIGAIYIDLGIDQARSFIERNWRPLLESAKAAPKPPKSALQEWCAANNRKVPVYEVTAKEGPPHAMRFEVTVSVKGFAPVAATANSKQPPKPPQRKPFWRKRMSQHCGHVAILGAPNAGKSTLTNALVGQKVAIVSPKAQTTRTRLMGIALEGDAQIILVDTPGIFAPNRRLDRAMVAAAWEGASDADLILMVVDGRGGAGPKSKKSLKALSIVRRGNGWF